MKRILTLGRHPDPLFAMDRHRSLRPLGQHQPLQALTGQITGMCPGIVMAGDITARGH